MTSPMVRSMSYLPLTDGRKTASAFARPSPCPLPEGEGFEAEVICRSRVRQFEADQLGTPRPWLSRAEQDELARWAAPARRRQWLAGRWLAKWLVERALGGATETRHVEILTRDSRDWACGRRFLLRARSSAGR